MRKKSTKKKVVKRTRQKTKKNKELEQISFLDKFNEDWDNKEHDNIYGLYGSPMHSLGVVKTFYSGLPTLDRILSVKRDSNIYGLPLNKIIEVFGAESCGKTTLSMYLISSIIKGGGLSYFVDFEHKFDPVWLRRISYMNGVSEELLKKRFRYVDPEHFEGFMGWLIRFMKKIIKTKNEARKAIIDINKSKKKPDNFIELIAEQQAILDIPFVIVVDSLAAIYTKAEKAKDKRSNKVNEEELKTSVAEIPNLFNRVLKNVRYYLGYTNTIILFLNQIRDNIDTTGYSRGSKIRTPCGNAVKHLSDARIQMYRTKSIKRTKNDISYSIGNVIGMKTVKNQMGPPPFQEINLKLLNDRGFFSFHSILEMLVTIGKVKRDGRYYKFIAGGEKVEVAESNADRFIDENPKYAAILHNNYKKYMEAME